MLRVGQEVSWLEDIAPYDCHCGTYVKRTAKVVEIRWGDRQDNPLTFPVWGWTGPDFQCLVEKSDGTQKWFPQKWLEAEGN